MNFTDLDLSGLILVEPKVFEDERGFFYESYRANKFAEAGIRCEFVQANHSKSRQGSVRGLHYQIRPGQAKLIRCTAGRVWDVALDIRRDSPTFGKWSGVELSAENKHMLFIPMGFAHGFSVLSENAEVQYLCSAYYDPDTEAGIAWNDPEIGVEWKVDDPIISQRDQNNPSFAEFKTTMGVLES